MRVPVSRYSKSKTVLKFPNNYSRKKTGSLLMLLLVFVSACGQSHSIVGNDRSSEQSRATEVTLKTILKVFSWTERYDAAPLPDEGKDVLGEDKNSDGVRDDVERYINILPDTAAQKEALRQTSRALTAVLSTDVSNAKEIKASSVKISNASSCAMTRYDASLGSRRLYTIQSQYINTAYRARAYDAYNRARSGSTSMSPMDSGCEN